MNEVISFNKGLLPSVIFQFVNTILLIGLIILFVYVSVLAIKALRKYLGKTK